MRRIVWRVIIERVELEKKEGKDVPVGERRASAKMISDELLQDCTFGDEGLIQQVAKTAYREVRDRTTKLK